MQVASKFPLWHCGVLFKLPVPLVYFMNLKVGGSNPLLGNGCFFITPRSCMVFCKTFYYQEMARIYPPNQKIQNAKFSTFWRFPPNAQNSWREPCHALLSTFELKITHHLTPKQPSNSLPFLHYKYWSQNTIPDLKLNRPQNYRIRIRGKSTCNFERVGGILDIWILGAWRSCSQVNSNIIHDKLCLKGSAHERVLRGLVACELLAIC